MRITLAVCGALYLFLGSRGIVQAQTEPQFDNGFAALSVKLGYDIVGKPVSPELPGDEEGSVVQFTTTGLLYWSPVHTPTFTDGHFRYTVDRQWEGVSLDPPPQPHSDVPISVTDPAAYIRANSKYGERAVCVSRIETGGWTAYYNKIAVGLEHAQGYFGWLPSTFYSVSSGSIMNLADEVAAFDRMLDRGRSKEFYGIRVGIC